MVEKHSLVEIITIGDEILIGQIVDTNSAWMAVELNKAGFELQQITSVHDDAELIIQAIDQAMARAQIVLLTGGIGPTKDDITKQTLCRYFNTELVFDQAVYDNIEELFSKRPYVMNPLTRAQAYVPKDCTVIQNLVGTAPITWFERNGHVLISMPGVPYEMKHAMNHEIIPRLQHYFKTPIIHHKTFLITGYAESALSIKIEEWEEALPAYLRLAYLPQSGIIRLRISGVDDDETYLEEEIESQSKKLRLLLGNAIIAEADIPIEELVGHWLSASGQTIAVAESCTGGNIAHQLTLVPGCSTYFKGGVVAYANSVKEELLKVPEDILQQYGAVSQSVVEQMALGVRNLLDSDIAIATSGIAGPDGGTEEKPVGLVWIAVCSRHKVVSRKFQFGTLREQNISRTTLEALLMVREIL